MKPFFSKEELQQSTLPDCKSCGLFKTCKSPKMKVSGKGKLGILVVAEAPGRTEDEQGVQLVGEAGQVLRKALASCGVDLDRDCWKTNAIACRPPNNRTPTKKEIKCCNPKLMKTIWRKKPKLILLLGGVALDSFLLDKFAGASGGINKWRGFAIPDQAHGAWIVPAFHPSFVLRSRGNEAIENIFNQDIAKAVKYSGIPFQKEDEYKVSGLLPSSGTFITGQNQIRFESDLLAFDYETTGLKPYRKGHEIVCCGYSIKENEAYVFEFEGGFKNWWANILKNKEIRKTAHNLKFEHQWSKEILGVATKGWEWDSMIASHVIDNRRGITGLKFQAYINFGQPDYSSHIEKYLKSDTATGFNKVKDAPREELLHYCGMDALLQFKLAKKQMEESKWQI